jgi:phosphatidylglycerol:prolipoprotein diacylglycerol transferase
MYLGWYGIGRLYIEGLRTDSLMIGSLRVSQIVALICIFVSVLLFARNRLLKHHDPDDLWVNRDKAAEAEDESESTLNIEEEEPEDEVLIDALEALKSRRLGLTISG